MLRFACPGCKTVLESQDAQGGSVFSCPKCSRKMKIPAVIPAMAASISSPAPTSALSGQLNSQPTPSKIPSVGSASCSETQNKLASATTPVLPQIKPAQSNARDDNLGRMRLWKRPFLELNEIAHATWGQTNRLFQFARNKWHLKSLTTVGLNAKLALGHRLVENKVGDEQIRNSIAGLDERIRILSEGKGLTKAPKAERDRLIMTLADEALAKPATPPGVEEEYRKAKQAQADLHSLTEKMGNLRAGLFPAQAAAWGRVVAGFTVVACLLFTPFLFLRGNAGNNETPDKEVRMAQNDHEQKPAEPEPKQNSTEGRTPAEQPLKKYVSDDNPLPGEQTSKKPRSESNLPEQGSLKDSQPSGTSVVFAEGVGTTEKEALMDAFRTAVQRVVGVFVDSETLVKNDAIISDRVLTFSDGAIKKYEELDRTDAKGLYRVKIKAAVDGRKVAARLEAAHISTRAVDVTSIADSFSKEIHADLEKLANEITEKEAKDNARKILENDLSRIAKINMIEAKIVGDLERGTKVGDKLPLRIKVRYEVNKVAFDEAMYKLEKSLLMNSSSWGKITFLATPDLIMKRDNQSSINEEIGKDNVFVLINKGLANEKWRSHWHYYVLPLEVGKLISQRLVEKKPPNIKLSLLDKDGQVVAVDEFTADNTVRAFQYNYPNVPNNILPSRIPGDFSDPEGKSILTSLPNLAKQYDIDISSAKGPGNREWALAVVNLLRSPQQPNYSTQPFNCKCYFASPFFFNLSPDIRYMMSADTVREIPFTLAEIKLIQSVKCEVFP